MTPPCPGGCSETIGRLSAQIVKLEVVANTLARMLVAAQDEMDAGRFLGDEAELRLRAFGGGGSA